MSHQIPAQSPESWTFESNSLEDTRKLGHALSKVLVPGTVVGLVGNLGAGKTQLVKAIAEGMGVDEDSVNSPTFVLIQEYAGREKLYHIDCYRLKDEDEFLELGVDELFQGDGIVLIEWADKFPDVLPDDVLWIFIEATGEKNRRLTILAIGSRSGNISSTLQKEVRRIG